MFTIGLTVVVTAYEVVARSIKFGKKGTRIISLVGVILNVAKAVSDKLKVK